MFDSWMSWRDNKMGEKFLLTCAVPLTGFVVAHSFNQIVQTVETPVAVIPLHRVG